MEVTLKRSNTQYQRKVSSDTKLNVVLAPGRYWERRLQARLTDLVAQKFGGAPNVRPNDTDVVVSVTGRSQPDFNKRFDGINIDWAMVQTQLMAWSQYVEKGKILRVNPSFNYVQVGDLPVSHGGKRGEKRGRTSTTQGMLHELNLRVEAERGHLWAGLKSGGRCTR